MRLLVRVVLCLAVFPTRCSVSHLRPRHPQRPDHRRHRLTLVLRRPRHPRRPDRRDRPARGWGRSRPWTREGQVVAPGLHRHAGPVELAVLVNPSLPSKIFQGITTEITGEGSSAAPMNDYHLAADRAGIDRSASIPTGARSPSTTPGWSARGSGSTSRPTWARPRCDGWSWATTTRIRPRRSSSRCAPWSRQAMRDGAVGLSTSLQYPPRPTPRRRS